MMISTKSALPLDALIEPYDRTEESDKLRKREIQRRYEERNKDLIKERQKAYYEKNREACRERQRARYRTKIMETENREVRPKRGPPPKPPEERSRYDREKFRAYSRERYRLKMEALGRTVIPRWKPPENA